MFLRTFVSVFLLQLFISLIFDAADNGVRVENSDFLATFGGDVDFQVVGFSNEHLESEVDPSLHVLKSNHSGPEPPLSFEEEEEEEDRIICGGFASIQKNNFKDNIVFFLSSLRSPWT